MNTAEHPWFGILVTLAAWVVATRMRKWFGTPLVDPVLVSVIMIIFFLMALGIPYENYNVGGSVISFLLGPAVVALAVPFYRHLARVRQHLFPVIVSVFVGAIVGIASASGLVYLLNGSRESVISVAPKSVTTPIAMEVSEIIGGTPPLTIAVVVLTGIFGSMAGPQIARVVRVKGDIAQRLAVGTAAHGLGTSRALRDNELKGAMSSIGMVLNGLMTALLLPLLVWLLS